MLDPVMGVDATKTVRHLSDKRQLGFIFVDLTCKPDQVPDPKSLHEYLCMSGTYQTSFVFVLLKEEFIKEVNEAAQTAALTKVNTFFYAAKCQWDDQSQSFTKKVYTGVLYRRHMVSVSHSHFSNTC